jgi:hypothetical protein
MLRPVPIAGHLWTVLPHLAASLQPEPLREFEPWTAFVEDPVTGPLQLHGLWFPGNGERAVVVVHGLGGGLDSPYVRRAGAAFARAGIGCLLLTVRGAAREGADFYHAGQTADIEAALLSPELSDIQHVDLLGFSLGGHMALRVGLEPPPRLRAIASVCSPLDLDRSAAAIDHPKNLVYRTHILRGLRDIYRKVSERGDVPTPVARIDRVRTIREWDSLTVVPRYGFGSVDDYYGSMSVGPQLSRMKVPVLVVASNHDPMLPPWTMDEALDDPGPNVSVRRVEAGGHVAFPRNLDLGMSGQRGLERQVLRWFSRHE